MYCQAKLDQISPPHSRSKRPRVFLPALVLGLFGSACGERLELGEIMQDLGDTPIRNTDQIATLIVDGEEDADAELDGIGRVDRGVGDVDGDGRADLFDADRGLLFGAPRPLDGVFSPVSGPTFKRSPDTLGLLSPNGPVRAGDIDGDGFGDLFLSGLIFVARGEAESQLSDFFKAAWPDHSAWLLYGAQERTSGDFAMPAVARMGDPQPRPFPTERVANVVPDGRGYIAQQSMSLRGIGDIDADGYDDFALTIMFALPAADSSTEITFDTYLFYGGPQRFSSSHSANQPVARLLGVSRVDALGDVDGDGFDDILFITPGDESFFPPADESVHLVRGSAQRFRADVSLGAGVEIEGVGVSPQGTALGDLDGDGYGDFTVSGMSADLTIKQHYLFYGGPARSSQPLDADFANAAFRSEPDNGLTALGDWNGDGYSDLLLAYERPSNKEPPPHPLEARVIAGTPERYSGRYDTAVLEPTAPRSSFVGNFTAVGDVDGDGLADIAFTGYGVSYIKYGGPLAGEIR